MATEQTVNNKDYIQAKAFLLSAIALSPFVWHIAFNFAVYNTIFYSEIFSIWAASLAALLSSLFLPKMKHELFLFSWTGRIFLALPTVLVGMEVLFYGTDDFELTRIVLSVAVALLSLPYILYFVIVALVPGTERLNSTRLRFGLFFIALCVGTLAFVVGKNHQLILSCSNFEVAGAKVPDNCFNVPSGFSYKTQ